MGVALLLYGLGCFIPDSMKALFVIYSIATRLLEGAGISTTLTAIVSLLTKLFPEEIGLSQSIRFLGAITGYAIGPVVSAFLIGVLGYFGVFLFFSLAIFFTSLLMFVFEEDASQENRDPDALTYWDLFKVRRVSLVMVCGLAPDLLLYSLESTLALKLRQSFNFPTSSIGLYFGIFLAGTIIVGSIGMMVPENWDKRKFLIVMLWINVVAPLLIGPSKVLHLPDEPVMIAVGLALGGSTRSLMSAFIIAEGVRGGLAKFP